jgi:hypothetical protein
VHKLVRRLSPEVVAEPTRVVIGKAQRETRFAGRGVRTDSTVVEADIRYPADGVLALQGARALAARAACWLAGCAARPCGWWTGRCQRIVTQIQQRQHGERITDRLVDLGMRILSPTPLPIKPAGRRPLGGGGAALRRGPAD